MFSHRFFPRQLAFTTFRSGLAFALFAGCQLSALRPVWSQPSLSPAAKETVVAKIGDQSVTRGEVDVLIRAALKGRAFGAEALSVLQAQALSQAIDRRLIEDYLKREGQLLSEKEVDNAIEEKKAEVKTKNRTWEQYLANTGMDEAELRREVAWARNWGRYLSRKIRDEQLQTQFDKHRREYDGTELRVSHILLRPARSGDPAAVAELTKQARDIRRQLEAEEITFAAAAQKFSAGPSRREAGDLGCMPRHGQMVEEFSRAAFALEKDQISDPVITTFGVHLIRWTEEKPGTKKWNEAIEPLRTAVAQEFFEKLAEEERKTAKVEFTGAMPHFKLGTRELVMP